MGFEQVWAVEDKINDKVIESETNGWNEQHTVIRLEFCHPRVPCDPVLA
jgi:hypothetical protein